jgi:adhesin/invasin
MTMLSRISFGCAVLLALVAGACDTVPLTAPSESTISISVASSFVPAGGTTQVTAFVAESSGTAVQNGTAVTFTTNLGRMEPPDTQTKNGYAVVTFVAGDASGIADIRATSGATGAGANGADATNTVKVTVGAAGVENVVLSANPSSVPSGGGTVELLATVVGTNGRSLQGILVTFASSEGQLGSATAATDANGQARTTLATNRTATVTASAGAKTSTAVTVTRRDPPSVATASVSVTPATPIVGVGEAVSFTATVTVTPADAAIQASRFEWDFGDGTSVTTTGPTTSHVYTTGPNSVRTVTVTISLTNGQTLVATTQFVLGNF